jgi:hypothetical protein
VKTSPERSYSVIENERFGLVFAKTASIISGTGLKENDGKEKFHGLLMDLHNHHVKLQTMIDLRGISTNWFK